MKSAWAEDGAPEDTADELREELDVLAAWLGLDSVRIEPKGDLAPQLAPLSDVLDRGRRPWSRPGQGADRGAEPGGRRPVRTVGRAAPRARRGSSPVSDLAAHGPPGARAPRCCLPT